MPFKRCVVHSCSNNNKNCPDKIFVCLPKKEKRRLRWYEPLKTTKIPNNSRYCVCEDHFNLPEDSLNWMYFKTLGKKIRLKDDVVPHKNMFPVDEVPDKEPNELTESSRKQNLHRAEVSSIKKAKIMLFEDVEQTAIASTSYKSSPSSLFNVELLPNHVGIQVRSQSTSTQDLVQLKSVGTLTKETAIQD